MSGIHLSIPLDGLDLLKLADLLDALRQAIDEQHGEHAIAVLAGTAHDDEQRELPLD